MRLRVIAVGRMKGPEADLCTRYFVRARDLGKSLGFHDVQMTEVRESAASSPDARKMDEMRSIFTHVPEGAFIVCLDESGQNLSSQKFANTVQNWREQGVRDVVFVIGGADGLDHALRDKARLTLAYGAATWPHQMVRAMVFEQIYRAMTVLAGHPYHRA